VEWEIGASRTICTTADLLDIHGDLNVKLKIERGEGLDFIQKYNILIHNHFQ
jgi:hypothetical protein